MFTRNRGVLKGRETRAGKGEGEEAKPSKYCRKRGREGRVLSRVLSPHLKTRKSLSFTEAYRNLAPYDQNDASQKPVPLLRKGTLSPPWGAHYMEVRHKNIFQILEKINGL